MKELRAKADIRDAETQKLEVTNAELRRGLLLRAEQQTELAQKSERSLRELEARWVVEELQASRVPWTMRPWMRYKQCVRSRGGQLLLSRVPHNPYSHTCISPMPGPGYTTHPCVDLTPAYTQRLLSRGHHAALGLPGLKGGC